MQEVGRGQKAESASPNGALEFRRLLEKLPAAAYICDADGLITYFNERAAELWGREPKLNDAADRFCGSFKLFTLDGAPIPHEQCWMALALRDGRAYNGHEIVIERADGSRWIALAYANPFLDERGKVSGAVNVLVDITERKRAEEALRLSEAQNRAIIAQVTAGIAQTDLTGKFVMVNERYCEIVGYTAAELCRMRMQDITHPDDLPRNVELFQKLASGGADFTIEKRYRRKDGSEVWVNNSVSAVRDASGRPQSVVAVALDITERKQAEKAKARLAAIVESSDDAIISKDLQGIITSWNKSAEKIYGYTAAEVIGKPVTMLFPPHLVDEEEQILENIRRGDRIDHYETVRRRKDGTDIYVSLTVSPIRDEAGKIIGASKIARDITERKRAEREREQLLMREQAARQQAEEVNRLKDEFVATVSHELRTPLNAILGWARMLTTGRLDEATAARGLKAIEQNARAQAQLIEDLLDVSRIISGKLRLNARPIGIAPVIEAAVDSVRPAADAKGVTLQVVLDPGAGPVSADPDRLQQVVWNLLTNAVKFTPKGGRVQVRLARVNSDVEIAVSDTGQGIAPEFLPYVFDRFRQADGSASRTHGGLGLGLAIVRHLVELHGGRVSADSAGKDQGATFTIRLPLIAVQTEKSEKGRAYARGYGEVTSAFQCASRLDAVKVLVVDDDPDSLFLLSEVLTLNGAQVRTASSAEEGFIAIKEWRPQVIVSDIGMPGEDGYAFMKRVKAWARESGMWIPAVALTAYARAEDRMKALAAGYQTHVPKPVEPAELIAVLVSLVERPTTPWKSAP